MKGISIGFAVIVLQCASVAMAESGEPLRAGEATNEWDLDKVRISVSTNQQRQVSTIRYPPPSAPIAPQRHLPSTSVLTCMAIAALVLLTLLYFTPTFVAHSRQHRNATPIFVLNLLLGWTFVGWVAALVWSLTAVENAIRNGLVQQPDESRPRKRIVIHRYREM